MATEEHHRIPLESGFSADNLRSALATLAPGVLQDGVLDVQRLAELLDVPLSGAPEAKERFGLMWAGRLRALQALQAPSLAALVPDPDNSVDWDTARNVFIEGDNLEVLKLLQQSYNDQISLIYIDPPYNTGNDFVYNDDFSDRTKRYLEVTHQIDAEGNRLAANTDVSGRKHSNWITMMYPRLMLARNLLRQDGAIFVSIDDNEVANLRLLLDEVFGPENFIGQFVWAAGRKNDSKFVSESHEYMIVYCRNIVTLKQDVGEWRTRKEGLDDIYKAVDKIRRQESDFALQTAAIRQWYNSLSDDNPAKRHKHYNNLDHRGLYFADNISWPGGGGPKYQVLHPGTKKPCKIPSRGWLFQENRMAEMIADDRIHFGADENSVPCVKAYLADREQEVPYSVFYRDGRAATKRLRTLLGGPFFDNPKDELVLQSMVEFASSRDGVILDFFAGSGTTGHSVMLQNQRDGGTRQYLLVNAPEPTADGSEARKAGFQTIPDITRLRLKKVMDAVPGAREMGLRCFRLGPSSFVDTTEQSESELPLLHEQTLRTDAGNDEIAAEALLKVGIRLDEPWERLTYDSAETIRAAGVSVSMARRASVEICETALKDENAHTVIFLEDSFAENDAVKTNAYFAFKQANKTMKTI